MGDVAHKRATYQDVLDAPPDQIAEVIRGVLHTHPRPRTRHARASSRLGSRLGGPFDEGIGGPGGWIILDEPELHLGPDPDIIVPDLAAWRRRCYGCAGLSPWAASTLRLPRRTCVA